MKEAPRLELVLVRVRTESGFANVSHQLVTEIAPLGSSSVIEPGLLIKIIRAP